MLNLPPVKDDQPDQTLRQRAAPASTLMASLELCREGGTTLEQNAPFRSIRVAPAPRVAKSLATSP